MEETAVRHRASPIPLRRPIRAFALGLVAAVALGLGLSAEQAPAKKALTVEDYTRWRSLASQEISGDGKWVTYVLQLTNVPTTETKPVLHLLNLETNQDVEVLNATGGTFSADSKWLAYQVDPSGGRGGRGGRGGAQGAAAAAAPAAPAGGETPAVDGQAPATPGQNARGGAAAPAPPRRVELRNLATGQIQSWQDIQSFTFSANSTHLLLRRRPPTPAGGAGRAGTGAAPAGAPGGGDNAGGGTAAAEPTGPRGVDVTVHNLVTGRDQLLGSVGDIGFNKSGELLAYTVDAAVKDSNGLFVLDLRNSRINTLDNDAKVYNRLTWSEDGTGLAVLKGADIDRMRERSNVLLVYPNVQASLGDAPEPAPVIFDPARSDAFPKGWVVSDRATLVWSDDNKRVFFGMKEQVQAPETGRRPSTDERADVDVWNSLDERIQSVQMIRADADRNFTFREAFDTSAS
jgi:hypothetical protein